MKKYYCNEQKYIQKLAESEGFLSDILLIFKDLINEIPIYTRVKSQSRIVTI